MDFIWWCLQANLKIAFIALICTIFFVATVNMFCIEGFLKKSASAESLAQLFLYCLVPILNIFFSVIVLICGVGILCNKKERERFREAIEKQAAEKE